MKTFEERYTAWIDGQLEGSTLTAFERELEQRATAGDAETAEVDKANALQLRALLKEHLQAPALDNTEFFNHQMRERIDAECALAARRREAAARPAFRFPAFAWPFVQFAGVGAACLFVAGALYYGLVPHQDSGKGGLANNTTPAPKVVQTPGTLTADVSPAPPSSPGSPRVSDNDGQFVNNTKPIPTPIDLDDIHVTTPNTGANNPSATTIRYPDANVVWLEGLTYLPNVNSTPASSPAPAASTSPAPGQPAARVRPRKETAQRLRFPITT